MSSRINPGPVPISIPPDAVAAASEPSAPSRSTHVVPELTQVLSAHKKFDPEGLQVSLTAYAAAASDDQLIVARLLALVQPKVAGFETALQRALAALGNRNTTSSTE